MNTAAVVGFVIGTIVMFVRIIRVHRGRYDEYKEENTSVGGTIVYWSLLTLVSMMFGAVFAALGAIASSPIVAFANRVDALERRCPPDTRPRCP